MQSLGQRLASFLPTQVFANHSQPVPKLPSSSLRYRHSYSYFDLKGCHGRAIFASRIQSLFGNGVVRTNTSASEERIRALKNTIADLIQSTTLRQSRIGRAKFSVSP